MTEGNGQSLEAQFKSRVMLVTPEMAAEWIATMPYEHQRNVRRWQVIRLAGVMADGQFIPGTTIRIAHLNGERYLLDGQHRLYAVVKAGIPQVFNVLEEWPNDANAVAMTYGNLDCGIGRDQADLFSALDLSRHTGLTSTQINHLAPAMEFIASGMITTKKAKGFTDRSLRLRMIRAYAPYMRQFAEIIAGHDRLIHESLDRSYVIAVAMLSLRFSHPYAVARDTPSVLEFWEGTVFDDGIVLGDPRKVANRHLLTTTMSNSSKSSGKRTHITGAYGARALAACFNAYMGRGDLKLAKVLDAGGVFSMYGVPQDYPSQI